MNDQNAFSIDLGEKHTRMSDIKTKNGAIEVVSLGYEETYPYFYSSETEEVIEQQADIITRLYNNLKIKKKNVNVIIPDTYSYSQIVEMPKLKEKELLAAIRYQADEFIPMSIDETNLDLEILKEDDKTNKILIFIAASPKKLVNQIQRTIEEANLNPTVLENELSSIGRLFTTVLKKDIQADKSGVLIVNIGYSSSSIYVLNSESAIITFSRTIKVGLSLFIKDVKLNLNWDDKKALEALSSVGATKDASYDIDLLISPILKELSKEIEKIIIVSREQYGLNISKMYLFNYACLVNGLPQKLQSYIPVPIKYLDLGQHIVSNTITQSFAALFSSFISVLSGTIE
jgi:type IV pilus assembly protein PilM